MATRIPKVDKDKCIGCNLCPALASGTFRLDENSKAEVFNTTDDSEETVQMAIDSCPTQAISWEE